MKKRFILLLILILCINCRISCNGIYNSNFSILSINGSNYQFLIVSTMTAVCASSCADMHVHPSSMSADTIYLRAFYDISGTCASAFCIDYDSLNFQNIYPTANVINISTCVFWEDPNNPGFYDSIWNIQDSNFLLNPLQTNEQLLENKEDGFTFYPNPSNGKLTIEGKVHSLHHPILIYDMTGRVVASYDASGLPATIDVTNLYNGLYMIQIGTKNEMFKVLKE